MGSLYTKQQRIRTNRRERSLYKWLAKVAGLEACWIEGKDEENQPLWGFIKKLAQREFAIYSPAMFSWQKRNCRKLIAASLFLAPLLFTPQVASAQTAVELSALKGPNGFQINGVVTSEQVSTGQDISSGDINGDGLDDLIIGAPYRNSETGAVYVVFGSSGNVGASLDISALNGTNGFVLNGISNLDRSGYAVASGDVNGDGIDDVIIGAYDGDPNGSNSGETYVVFGKTTAFSSSIEISDVIDGTNGFIMNGIASGNESGFSVSSGDINNDGKDDVIIGAPKAAGGLGETYVVFGFDDTSTSTIELSALNGTTGFKLTGNGVNDYSGRALSSGDINGDSIDDIIIGAPYGGGANTAGQTYVVFGKTTAFSSDIELSSLNGTTGFTLRGITEGDFTGRAVSAGDINGDTIGDVIIGARNGDPGGTNAAGETFVVFGKTTAFSSSIEISDVIDGTNGFVMNGIGGADLSGQFLSSGDINGDGTDDVIIGAYAADPNGTSSGETYVVFGFNNTSISTIELSSLDGSTGFALNGLGTQDRSGTGLASGDINGDGFDEVLVGSPNNNDNGTYAHGVVHVLFNNVNQEITGNEGFRTLSAPSSGTVFNELLGGFFTQGFTGSDAPSGSENVWTWDQATQAWTALTNQATNSLSAGNGFLFYLFSDDNGPSTAGDAGFPKRISVNQFGGSGTVNSGSINPVSNLADNDFFFAGNPYLFPIDWDELTKTNLSNTVYVYDDANATWQSWNGSAGNLTNGEIAPFQGFFIQGSGGSGSLTIEEADTVSTSITLLKVSAPQPKALKISAEAGDYKADAWLSFQEGGKVSRDDYDGLALAPLTASYLRLATIIDTQDVLSINALPVDQSKELMMPLELSGTIDAETATLFFEGLEKFEDWTFAIHDAETDKRHELAAGQTIDLQIRKIKGKESTSPALPVRKSLKSKSSNSRYNIILTPAVSVSNEGPASHLPEHVHLEQNYPNPFNPSTQIAFGVPRAGLVSLEVYDLLGRKVSTLVNAHQAAGSYTVTFDASALSSGVYIYRLQVGNQTLFKKMTLIK